MDDLANYTAFSGALVLLAAGWLVMRGLDRRPSGPRRPPTKPPTVLRLLEDERLMLAEPGQGRHRRIGSLPAPCGPEVPPRPDTPPPGHVWITPADPHDADTRELPCLTEGTAA